MDKRMLGRLCATVLMTYGIVSPVRADDTAATLAAGELVPVKTTSVSMAEEDLRISARRIDVAYRFRNDTDHDVKTLVEFPLPVFSPAVADHQDVPLPFPGKDNFVGFHVTVNGKPIDIKMNARPFVDNNDVTSTLEQAGLSPEGYGSVSHLPEKTQAFLTNNNLIGSDYGDGSNAFARWDVHSSFYWKQVFLAHASTRIEHSYVPVAGGDNTFPISNTFDKCAPEFEQKRVRDWIDKGLDPDTNTRNYDIRFILVTGNNWNGPIGKFTPTVQTEHPDDIAMTCLGPLKQISPTEYRLTIDNFQPKNDLDVRLMHVDSP